MSEKFVCSRCGNEAHNSTMFRQKESPYNESVKCPKCECEEIISKEKYDKHHKNQPR